MRSPSFLPLCALTYFVHFADIDATLDVQAGLTGRHRFSRGNYTPQDEMAFQVEIPEDPQEDLSLYVTLKHLHPVSNSSQSIRSIA